ncbi:MAG TPA: glycosyltransferase [Candidatus Sulfotelmatobacter sp.]|nr:glycosyltransferase [Candidatus Sulfotelmatobacter sp.]
MIASLIAAFSCLIWIYLIAARGRFWRVALPVIPTLKSAPAVSVIIPARNEAEVIAGAVRSLLRQDYPGPLQIFVVDDHSSDPTAEIVRGIASADERIALLQSAPLTSGWTGKMWALAQGVEQAAKSPPEYFLFTDADIVHAPDSVASLVALAQAGNRDMVSMMVKLHCESFAEHLLIPAFVFFFFMLYPPEWVNNLDFRTAAAAGGDILIRSDALTRIGGIAAIRNELIDDCALAREVKRGGPIWLGLTEKAWSIRPYDNFGVIGRMISRNAFYQLRHSLWLLVGTILGLAITYIAPPVAILFGSWAAFLGGAGWLMMSLAFWPILRFYSLSPLWAPALPLIAAFYGGATLHSAVQYWMGTGGEWKGRVQDSRAGVR